MAEDIVLGISPRRTPRSNQVDAHHPSFHHVSLCLTSLAPQPPHRPTNGHRFPWSEDFDRASFATRGQRVQIPSAPRFLLVLLEKPSSYASRVGRVQNPRAIPPLAAHHPGSRRDPDTTRWTRSRQEGRNPTFPWFMTHDRSGALRSRAMPPTPAASGQPLRSVIPL